MLILPDRLIFRSRIRTERVLHRRLRWKGWSTVRSISPGTKRHHLDDRLFRQLGTWQLSREPPLEVRACRGRLSCAKGLRVHISEALHRTAGLGLWTRYGDEPIDIDHQVFHPGRNQNVSGYALCPFRSRPSSSVSNGSA